MPQLAKNSRLGFATFETGLHRGFAVCNSTTALGLRGTLALEGSGAFSCARYYDPQIGRFISEDPIGFKGGINFYRYALNSPLILIDPDGRDVTVVHYTATNPRGHVGLGVNSDTTEGFYPDKDNYQAVIGGPGHVQVDTHQVTDYVVIPTTPDQDRSIQLYIDQHQKGHYSFLNSNCARFVEHALAAGGVSSSNTIDPITLMQDLHQRYDPPAPVPPPDVQD